MPLRPCRIMHPVACTIPLRSVFLTMTTAVAVVQCFTVTYTDRYHTPTSSNHSDFSKDFVFLDSTIVGINRSTVDQIIYTSGVVALVHIKDKELVVENSSNSVIYRVRDFGPARLTFEGNQLALWDGERLVALLLLPGWPRVDTRGQAEIMAYNATGVRSEIFIQGTPSFNGSHILLTANNVITASYKSEGFPVITNYSVNILERNFNISNQMASESNMDIKGQISQCGLRNVEVKRDLVTLLSNSQHTCATISLPRDIVLQTISTKHILLRDVDKSDLVRLDLSVTTIKHNGTHISLDTAEGVTVDSPTSGKVMIKSRNTEVSISSSHSVSVAGDLPLHSGVFHNGTHLLLGDAATFFAPGRPSLRVGMADIVTNEGTVSASVEVSSRVLIKEGLIHLNDTHGQAAVTFTAPGVPHVTKGNVIIQQKGAITANVSHSFTSIFYNGLQLQLLDGIEAVILAHAEGSAILNSSMLHVIKDDSSLAANIETSSLIDVSLTNITFAETVRQQVVVVARKGNLVYNGTHLADVDRKGIQRLVLGIWSSPRISKTSVTFGEQSNCSPKPCLTMNIAGSFLYNSSTIRLSNAADSVLLKANASLVTIAKGALRFIGHNHNELLASALYADTPTLYLRSDSAELLPLHERCSSALESRHHLANRSHDVVVRTNGWERVHNGSHMIVYDEQGTQTIVMESTGDLIIDTVGRSCCIEGGNNSRSVHLIFDIGHYANLANGRIIMNADQVTYNMSVPGLPVYNGSHVNIHDGDTVSASVVVSSLATLFERTLFFKSENGATLLEAAVKETSVMTLSNDSLDVGGRAEESPSFRLLLGQAHVKYFPTHIDIISATKVMITSINYTAGFARVTKKETIVTSTRHNITLDVQAVPRFSNGLFNMTSKSITFTASVPNGKMSCSVDGCTLAKTDNPAVLKIDTDGAAPIFSESVLTMQSFSDYEPSLVADIDGELYLNGSLITSPTTDYDFKASVAVVCNGTDLLLSTGDGQLPSAIVKDIISINVTSADVVFSRGEVRRVVLPPLIAMHIRTVVNDSADALPLESDDCVRKDITTTGPVPIHASLSGKMVLMPRKALHISSSSFQSLYVDGIDLFTFSKGKFFVKAGTTNLSVDSSWAVPHFSDRGVDLITRSGTKVLEIEAPLAVPRYNCSHIILENDGQDNQPLGLFEAHDVILHYESTTGKLILLGMEDQETLASIVNAWSITINHGTMTARSSDGEKATAYLCAPGEVRFADGVLRLQGSSGRHVTQFAIDKSSLLTFKTNTATFTGPNFNLTIQFSEKTIVVRPGNSVSIEGAHFQVAGIPVDNGAGRLRLFANNGTSSPTIVSSGPAIAEITYSGMPLFVNGTVVYADSNDPSRTVVIENTGRPYVYLRAKDTDALLQSGALSNGTVAQSWIVARPDNESVGALRLLQNSNLLKFNGTHLVVYDGNNNNATAEPVTIIALLAKSQPVAGVLCREHSKPAQTIVSDPATSMPSTETAEHTDTILRLFSVVSTQGNEEYTPLTMISTAAEPRDGKETSDLPETTPVVPELCNMSSAITSVIPVLTADCVLHFLENGKSLLASVQMPHGCRLRINQSGNISIEDDSGVLAMSFEHAQGDAVSVAGGVASVSDVAGRQLLSAHFLPEAMYVLDGENLKVLRPDGSVAIALEQSCSFNSSAHRGIVVASPRPGGSGRLALDLNLQSSDLTAFINGSSVALLDQNGTLKALLTGVARLDAGRGLLFVEKPLALQTTSSSDSATPASQSEQQPTTLAAIDLAGGGNLIPLFNGTHLIVIDPDDGHVRAVVVGSLSTASGPDESSDEALWATLENAPQWRLFVRGVVNPDEYKKFDNVTKTVMTFSQHDGERTHSELLFGSREAASSSDNPSEPLLLGNDTEKRPTWLRVNSSLVIVDGLHLKYRLADGTVVARVNFVGTNDSEEGSWYSSSNGTHIIIRSSDGEVLSVMSVRGTPSPSNDAAHWCQEARKATTFSAANVEESTVKNILSSSFDEKAASEVTMELTKYQSLVFRTQSSGPEVIVCLPPEVAAYTNESLDHWVIGGGAEGKRYVVAKPSLTTSATTSEPTTNADLAAADSSSAPSSADGLLTADPNISIPVAPVLDPRQFDTRYPVPPHVQPVVSDDPGGSGTLATRFAFIVMLTVCAMFLLGAVTMYAILHWTNREHDYILSRK